MIKITGYTAANVLVKKTMTGTLAGNKPTLVIRYRTFDPKTGEESVKTLCALTLNGSEDFTIE